MSNNNAKQKLDPTLLRIAMVLVIGSLAPLLDSTMANIAVKTMVGDFHSTVSVVQWVITGYVLAMSVAVPFSGWALNRFGGKRLYMFSLALFFAGSILSALSWNVGSLIAFRLIQGFAAGLMMPTTATIVMQTAGGRSIGRLMSVVGIPAMIGPILGPVLGGIIVDSLSWRWIFYINIPICIVALLLTRYKIPTDKPSDQKQPLDIIGILFLSGAFSILIFGIAQISKYGGLNSSNVAVPLITGFILMVTFVIYTLNKKNHPVLDLRLFRSRNFTASNALLFLSGIVTNGTMLLLPLYYQQVRGESVLYAGLLLIPQGIGMLLTRSWAGKLFDRIGARVIVIASLLVTMVGTIPFAFANAETNQVILIVGLLVRGAGLGGLLVTIMSSAYIGLDKRQIPDASTATRIFQTIGGAFGSAILATIVAHQLADSTDIQLVSNAYNIAFWWSIGFAVIAIIPAIFIPKR